MAKNITYQINQYYFIITVGNSRVTIRRPNKEDALHRFSLYQQQGKNIEWLGRWNGKCFDEDTLE